MFTNQFLDYQSWVKEIDEDKKREEEETIKAEQDIKKNLEESMKKYRELHGDYWEGPAGVLIPLEICEVQSLDGINATSYMLLENGKILVMQTSLGGRGDPLTDSEYRMRYAELRDDGKWYWKGNDPNHMWQFWNQIVGPAIQQRGNQNEEPNEPHVPFEMQYNPEMNEGMRLD